MKKAGKMWILDEDSWFEPIFKQTGDRFEHEHLEYAITLVTDWRCALDVGANYGSWTRTMADHFDKVVAFEGRTDIYDCLLKNTEHYSNVEAHHTAIGEQAGNVRIGLSEKNKHRNVGASSILGPGETPMITIDSLNLQTLGFIKMDIEGYEIPALRGAAKTIQRLKPIMIVEDNQRNLDFGFNRGDTCALIKSWGAVHVKQFKGNHIFKWE